MSSSLHTSTCERTPAQRFISWLNRDIRGFIASIAPERLFTPGLHTYLFRHLSGSKHIHLRIEQNGAGVLFDNLTHILHLNQTATCMAKLVLDDFSLQTSSMILSRLFSGVSLWQLTRELKQVSDLIERMKASEHDCPLCDYRHIIHTPLFSRTVSAPFKTDIALTYQCNNGCSHCYNPPDRKRLTSLGVKQWYRVLDNLADRGIPHIIFTGGEPTLYPYLADVIAYAQKRGQITGLNTNGRRLADVHYAGELAAAGLNHVQITLESSRKEIHDSITRVPSFHETINGIESSLATIPLTITNTTINRYNKDHLLEIIDLLYSLGVQTFAMNSMIHSGCGRSNPATVYTDELRALLIQVRDYADEHGMRFIWYTPTEYCRLSPHELGIGIKRCNAGEYSMCIEPNGDVLPCQSYYTPIGNILSDDWDTIWNSDLFRRFRNRTTDPAGSGLPKKCYECSHLDLCGGGCPLEREIDYEQQDISCDYQHEYKT